MATKLDIQIKNGVLTITVGGAAASAAKQGGQNPANPSDDTGGAGPGCCGLVVMGPFVVDASAIQGSSGQGGQNPANPSDDTGGSVGSSVKLSNRANQGGQNPANPSDDTGGGGPGCCCAPVVLGPIVIRGCCSGHASASPVNILPPAAQPIALSPPARRPGLAPLIFSATDVLAFTMQPQQEENWCWAAVAASINDFLDPQPAPAPPLWTQGAIASPVMVNEYQFPPPPHQVDCSKNPEVCDYPASLDDALTVTKNLSHNGFKQNCFLTFESLKQWIDEHLPVAARIVWRTGGAHFVALDGYQQSSSGDQYVHVQDPDSNYFGPGIHLYEDLVKNYRNDGNWQDTYLVTK